MADFQDQIETFEKRDVRLVAASVDSLEDASNTVDKNQLTFPVAHGLDAKEVSRLTGSFYKDKKKFLQASGFVLNRNGTIIVAVYSTGAIGRLTARDSLKLIEYLQEQQAEQ